MSRAAASKVPSPAAHAKKWARFNLDPARDRPDLERYARGEKFEYGITGVPERFPYGPAEACFALRRIVGELTQKSHVAALTGAGDWLPMWNQAVSYSTLALALDFAWHEHAARELHHGKRRQALRTMSLRDAGFLVGAQLSLGHLDAAAATTQRCRGALGSHYFLDGDEQMPRRAQYFVLQLVTESRGESMQWPPVALDEPVYASLRETWRGADPAALAPLLLAACDRHLAESRPSDGTHYFDCETLEANYFPFEIHALLRLRESAGLAGITLEHPLLATALGPLPAGQAPWSDALLEGVAKAAGVGAT
jgi:hypothetical protein